MLMHMQCQNVVVGVDGVVSWWLGGWSDRQPSLVHVVVSAVSFGGVCIRDAHAMRNVSPVLSECVMHDAMVA